MEPINLNKLTMHGELAMRANLNYARLETARYWPETIFDMGQHAWPADWEGRTILALAMHAQSTGRTPAFLDEILERLPERLNEKGYLGPVYDEGVANEQSMSGHSWMIRGLVEYHGWIKASEPGQAEKAITILKGIVDGLYVPQTENYRNYPIEKNARHDNPNWMLSQNEDPNMLRLDDGSECGGHSTVPDIGCAFIALDGATAAYELLEQENLKPLIEAMIDSFGSLPLEKLHVQTHATLSGIRGILRWHRITGAQHCLQRAVEAFDLYKASAWTGHYANYNWFGLPLWTEPCAIVDSFIVAQELWEITGKEKYLRDAHHILYNAIAHAERGNGAFGTDQCVGARAKSGKTMVFARSLTYEVYWCCNMRGGDGLARAAMYSFYTDGNTVTLPYFHTCKAELELRDGALKLHETADYPFSGKILLRVLENSAGTVKLRLFAPEEWTSGAASKVLLNDSEIAGTHENGFVCVETDLEAGDVIVFDTEIKLHVSDGNACAGNSKDHFSFRHGPMMLGVHSVLEDAEADPEEINIPRNAEPAHIDHGRYETRTVDGKPIVLRPMWGKENLIEPLDVFQILFAK
ncbi:MAG: hypothetical protein ABFR33_05065 [Verrucomicrobiota bacterium]